MSANDLSEHSSMFNYALANENARGTYQKALFETSSRKFNDNALLEKYFVESIKIMVLNLS